MMNFIRGALSGIRTRLLSAHYRGLCSIHHRRVSRDPDSWGAPDFCVDGGLPISDLKYGSGREFVPTTAFELEQQALALTEAAALRDKLRLEFEKIKRAAIEPDDPTPIVMTSLTAKEIVICLAIVDSYIGAHVDAGRAPVAD